jgi:hypothetical protein
LPPPLSLPLPARRQGEAAKTRVLAAFEPLAAPMRELIAATDPSVIVEHGLFIRPAEDMTEQAFGKGGCDGVAAGVVKRARMCARVWLCCV